MEEDIEDIKRLDALIKAESSGKEKLLSYELPDSGSSDSDDSDNVSTNSDGEVEETEMGYMDQINSNAEFLIQNYVLKDLEDLSKLSPHLSYEEYQIISECEDPILKRLLILNRIKKAQLKYLHGKYHKLLVECDINKKYEEDKAIRLAEINRRSKEYNFTKVGSPYFRDEENFPAPPNNDMIRKKHNSEVNTLYFLKKRAWNVCNEVSLKSNVMMNYFKNLLKCMEVDLKWAKIENDKVKQAEVEQKIAEHTQSFDKLEPPDFWDDTNLNWEDIAKKQFNDVSSARACRGFWNLCIHPLINKDPVKEEEKERLLELVEKHDEQNWDQIVKELNTNRSPYLLASSYFNKYIGKNPPYHNFTKEENEKLMRLIEQSKVGHRVPWRKIAEQFGVSTVSLYQKYRYKHLKNEYKVGKFLESEDKLLMCLATKYNEDFDKISCDMPHRRKQALKNRYFSFLKPPFSHYYTFTVEEDREILNSVRAHGDWDTLGKKMNRIGDNVRERFSWLKYRMLKNPGVQLEDLPRKCGKSNATLTRVFQAHMSMEHYKKTNELPVVTFEEFDSNTSSSIKGRPQRQHIDHCLTDYFRSTAHIRKERYRKSITSDNIKKCTQSVHTILNALGVKLNIPDDQKIETHSDLNIVDVEVLKSLKKLAPPEMSESPKEDISPNVNTIQALRCLLVRCGEYKSALGNRGKVTVSDDPEVQLHRDRFADRFRSLFRWPCMMSIAEPPKDFEMEKVITPPVSFQPEQRKIGRPPKNLIKIQKMNEARKKLKEKQQKVNISIEVVTKKELLTEEDEKTVDDTCLLCPNSSKSIKRGIDLLYEPLPESSLINLKLPVEIPDMNKSLTNFRQVTQGLNKNIQATQTKVIKRVTRQELEEMKKKGSKFMVLKSIKRPASCETSEINVAKKIKVLAVNKDT